MNIVKYVVMIALFASAAPFIQANKHFYHQQWRDTSRFEFGKRVFENTTGKTKYRCTTLKFRSALKAFNNQPRKDLTHSELIEMLDMLGAIYQIGSEEVPVDTSKALAYYQEALEHTKIALNDTWQISVADYERINHLGKELEHKISLLRQQLDK